MDKNGKLFGKVSIIDILVLLAVIVGIAGFSVRFFSSAAENVNEKTKFEYVVEIQDVRSFTVDALAKKGLVTEKKSGDVIGEIVNVESKNYTLPHVISNGRVILVDIPEKYVVNVTVVGEGNETSGGYYIGENVELSVGSTITMASKYANSTGKVKSIKVLED